MIKIIAFISLAIAIFIDSFFIGFVFRFSPKFEGFRKGEEIILQAKRVTGFTLKEVFWPLKRVIKEYYRGVISVILTDQRILFKPQLLTCALSLDYTDILKITEERYFFKQYICLHYYQEGGEKKFYFRPKPGYRTWLKTLREFQGHDMHKREFPKGSSGDSN